MSFRVKAFMLDGRTKDLTVYDMPDQCPQCQFKGVFTPLNALVNSKSGNLEILFRCSNKECQEGFFGYYNRPIPGYNYTLSSCAPHKFISRKFSKTVTDISHDFPEIFNQALQAENGNLNQVSGPGFRKALEFLIKDYLIKKTQNADEKEKIKDEFLGTCISGRIQDANIKGVAKRAVWLGNDETHYTRKWEQKDLQDLKNLINLTVHWMEAEALTTELLNDMPENTTPQTTT